MKKTALVVLLLSLVLAACSSPAATQAPAPTARPAPTQAPTLAPTLAPTSAPAVPPTGSEAQSTQPPAASSGQVKTYAILPDQSKVSYSVGEVFLNDNNRFNLAVGTTQQVNGEIFLDFADPTRSTVGPMTVDISTFKSDSSRRDNAIRGRWLESGRYPTAVFTPREVKGIPADYQEGTAVQLEILGDLTVRDVTRPVIFTVEAALSGEQLQGKASTNFLMSDFGFSPPDIAGMLKAEDKVQVDFDFVATPKP